MIYVCGCEVGEQTHSRRIYYGSRLVSYYDLCMWMCENNES